MRFLTLTVENLGVFRGQHHFDLASLSHARRNGNNRPLVVIAGHNGAGKSTLFQALALALHGPLALGDRVTRQAYSDFLLGRLHRRNESGKAVIADNGLAMVSFQFVQSGQPLHIQVERSWKRTGQNVFETLQITQNGSLVDVDTTDYQTWLDDLFPPGLLSLCFFDAEKLDSLSSPERYESSLGEILYRLLGLDLVERLQSDLMYHSARLSGGHKIDTLRNEVTRHQTEIDMLDEQIKQMQSDVAIKDTEVRNLEKILTQKERQLAAEGGHYAVRRAELQERSKVVRTEIEQVAVQLRDFSAELLPFAFAPELCVRLNQRLEDEARVHRNQIAQELLCERLENIKSEIYGDQFWQGIGDSKLRKNITDKLVPLLKNQMLPDRSETRQLIHHLSEPDQTRIQGWIAAVLQTVPQQAETLGKHWRRLQAEQSQIDIDLQRAPSEETLAPLHAEIAELQAKLDQIHNEQTELTKQIGGLQFRRDEQFQHLQRAVGQLESMRSVERQQVLADRSRSALRVYQDALIRQRLASLEEALVLSFNAICRKEYLLSRVEINPDNFQVQLYSEIGTGLNLKDFSAGERQLYALALLQALRRISRRQLPLIIDTPLARLDETHRQRFIQEYLPEVSDQVILIVTDAEMDADLLELAAPHLMWRYELNFNGQDGQTIATRQDSHIDRNDSYAIPADFTTLGHHNPASSPASHNGVATKGDAADHGI